MGSLGVPELIVVFVLALLVFGPRKLPELGRNLGKALAEFRRASSDLRMAVEEEMRELDRQAREIEGQAREAIDAAEPQPLPPQEPAGSGRIDSNGPGQPATPSGDAAEGPAEEKR